MYGCANELESNFIIGIILLLVGGLRVDSVPCAHLRQYIGVNALYLYPKYAKLFYHHY